MNSRETAQRRTFQRGGNKPYSYAEAVAAFWCKLDMSAGPSACWPWLGAYRYDGYGHVCFQRKQSSAHQRAYQIVHGPIPAGMWVLHTCDNRKCANPAHLWLGTRAANVADMVAKGRQCRGNKNLNAILNDDLVREMRSRYRTWPGGRGKSRLSSNIEELVAAYPSVNKSTIYHAVKGNTWKHIK